MKVRRIIFELNGPPKTDRSTYKRGKTNKTTAGIIVETVSESWEGGISQFVPLFRDGGPGSGISKPMVCMQGGFHENDGNPENDEDNSDSYKEGVECWISGGNHRNHGHDQNHGNPGCKPRVPKKAGLEYPALGQIRVCL